MNGCISLVTTVLKKKDNKKTTLSASQANECKHHPFQAILSSCGGTHGPVQEQAYAKHARLKSISLHESL
jgi:hypothetical protein